MSYRVARLDQRKRALEKQASRERDQARLNKGSVSASELRVSGIAPSPLQDSRDRPSISGPLLIGAT